MPARAASIASGSTAAARRPSPRTPPSARWRCRATARRWSRIRQTFTEPPTLVSIDTRGGAATQALHVQRRGARRASTRARYESVTYKGAKDADIQMWVVYPPGFDATKKYPVLMLLHGGPHNAMTDAVQWRWNARGVRELGLRRDVAQLPRLERLRQRLHGLDQSGLDHAAVRGHDQGRGLAHGREAVHRQGPHGRRGRQLRRLPRDDVAGPARIRSRRWWRTPRCTTSTRSMGADYGAEKERFFNYWEKPEEFAKYSPHMSAGNFKTPTLIIHNQLDLRVPRQSRHRAVQHAAEARRAVEAGVLPGREPLGAEAAELAVLVSARSRTGCRLTRRQARVTRDRRSRHPCRAGRGACRAWENPRSRCRGFLRPPGRRVRPVPDCATVCATDGVGKPMKSPGPTSYSASSISAIARAREHVDPLLFMLMRVVGERLLAGRDPDEVHAGALHARRCARAACRA